MKINLGCGQSPLEGYVNVDMDTLEDLRRRYPNKEFSDDLVIEQWDIFNLPVEDESVDEVRSECLFEHLSFKEERLAFEEVDRVLKVGGLFNLTVPDFDSLVEAWLKAEDNWKDWYRDDDEAIEKNHWFGNYSYSFNNKWGYLTASIFGSQNGEGQFHKNCYTKKKLDAIFLKMNYMVVGQVKRKWPRGDCDVWNYMGVKL